MHAHKKVEKALYPDSPELQLNEKDIQDIIENMSASQKIEEITKMSPEQQILIEWLQKDIVWQDEACYEIADLIETWLLSTFNRWGPLGVAFLAGPTWVWKTQIARTLAKFLLWNEANFTKIACENLQESHATRSLLWAPPSYVGYGENTSISPDVLFRHYHIAKKRKQIHPLVKYAHNFSILLFDEIEKAHPNVRRCLLWLLEDGEVTFNNWDIANYSNTFIIFTSNIWQSEASKSSIGFGNSWDDEVNSNFESEFKKAFLPEFRWRLGMIRELNHISKDNCREIIWKHIKFINKSLKNYYIDGNLYLSVSDSVVNHIIEKWYSKEYWARDIPRKIEKYIWKSIGSIIRKDPDIVERKNPTIIHFDVDQNTNEIYWEIYKKNIIPEKWIIDEDYETNEQELKSNLIGRILKTSDLIRLSYEQLADEYSLEEDEIDILQWIDWKMVQSILEQMETDWSNGLNLYSNADIFGSIKPRGLFKLIQNLWKDLYAQGNYSKEMFVMYMIIKSHSCVQWLMKDETLTENQSRTLVKFSIKAGLKIWNRN